MPSSLPPLLQKSTRLYLDLKDTTAINHYSYRLRLPTLLIRRYYRPRMTRPMLKIAMDATFPYPPKVACRTIRDETNAAIQEAVSSLSCMETAGSSFGLFGTGNKEFQVSTRQIGRQTLLFTFQCAKRFEQL
jgi:hypothetical protein